MKFCEKFRVGKTYEIYTSNKYIQQNFLKVVKKVENPEKVSSKSLLPERKFE